MTIAQFNIENLQALRKIIERIDNEQYKEPLEILSGSSIGGHVRHILEFYICLLRQSNGRVCYDNRERNQRIETERNFALIAIDGIISKLESIKEDYHLTLQSNFSTNNNEPLSFGTTLYRELAYCLEHSVHHEALIKIGAKSICHDDILVNNFGVAASTLRYKETH